MNFYNTPIRPLKFPVNLLGYFWAAPNTLFGLLIGLIAGFGKVKFVVHQGVIGIYGPGIARLLRHFPFVGGAWAVTLGHSVLACDEKAWTLTFSHEYVHVRQYEWLGPFFIPLYFGESIWQWSQGRHPYLDNRFEVQARKFE